MASESHKQLAMTIKQTHSRLREDFRRYGPEQAWLLHTAQTDKLQHYASSMRQLATVHWIVTNENFKGKLRCRIRWIKTQCYEYFLKGGYKKFYQREIDIISKMLLTESANKLSQECLTSMKLNNLDEIATRKINLLDVGSCYNPFVNDNDKFHVTAIDLVPYGNHVLHCDFLRVKIGAETIINRKKSMATQFKENSFDVCIFSLLLEYFPCPKQRFLCCQNAYKLLKDSGILIIITPDSKHMNANTRIMKSWRIVLANLGFMRINYEKLKHVHCLTFRKCINKDTAVRWIKLQKNIPTDDILFSTNSSIFIPQDFQSSEPKKPKEYLKFNENDIVNLFHELPNVID